MIRRLQLSIVAAVVIAVLWLCFGAFQPTRSTPEIVAKMGTSGRDSDRRLPDSLPTRAPERVLSAGEQANPFLREAEASTDRRATFERLAAVGNPIAAHTAATLAISCHLYGDKTYQGTLSRIEASSLSSDIKARQRAIAARERSKCIGFDSEMFRKATQLETYVTRSGDPRGILGALPIKPDAIPDQVALAQQGARLSDPLALNEVGMFFTARSDVARGASFDIGNGVSVPSSTIRDAFFLVACEYGSDCGPQNVVVTSRCVNSGWCDANSVGEALSRYSYTPAEADKLNAAVQMVRVGIQTGQWPPDLWRTPH